MLLYVIKYMLLYVIICYYMLLYVIICYYMLLYVIICYYMFLFISISMGFSSHHYWTPQVDSGKSRQVAQGCACRAFGPMSLRLLALQSEI